MELLKQVEKNYISADNLLRAELSEKIQWSLTQRDVNLIELLMPVWSWLYRYYFQVKTDGWHHIPTEGKVLLVGSHNGGMASPDLVMMMYDWFSRFGTERLVYGLMHPYAWKVSPEIAQLAQKVGAIVAHPKMASVAFEIGASVLVYPGEQLALWINLYNGFTISTILERYPIESIRPRIFHKSLLPSLRDAARTYFCLLNSPHNVTVFEQNSLLSPIKNSRI